MTTTESAIRVAGVAAEAMTVETKEEGEESATGPQTSEKMDVDEKNNSIFGGGAQAELGVVFTPEERGGSMGDLGTAEFIRFSSDDKINNSGSGGVGEENPPPVAVKNAITAPADDSIPGGGSGGGSLGKVIHLKLLPSIPLSSSSSVVHHNNKRYKKRKKTRGIESFADVDDDNGSRKTQRLPLDLLGGDEGGGPTATISGVKEKEEDEKVEGVGGSESVSESSRTLMIQPDEEHDCNAGGDDGGLHRQGNTSPSRHVRTPPERAMSPIPQREEVGGRPARSSPNAPVTTPQQQHYQQQYAQQQLQNRFQGSSGSNSTSDADQSAQGPSQQSSLLRQQQRQLQRQLQQQQPPGWRVKLYRLNADGSWDDCGTGRIQFYYARTHQQQLPPPSSHAQQQLQQQQSLGGSDDDEAMSKTSTSTCQNLTSSTNSPSSPTWIFRKLGEPMLCMRAEVSQQKHQQEVKNDGDIENVTPSMTTCSNSSNNATLGRQKVLLRTRVITLHDTSSSAYQCQGGNIITWCEPLSMLSQCPPSSSASVGGGGVDLALSFQDNAGCKDIWQHITNVQARAKELLLLSSTASSTSSYNNNHHLEETTTAQTLIWTSSGGGIADGSNRQQLGGGGGAGGSVRDGSLSRNLYHHQQQQHDHIYNSPPKQPSPPPHSPLQHPPHQHSFLHNSPNSPDHDAVEDRQLLSLVSSPLGVGGVMKPSPLFSSMGIPSRPPLLAASGDIASLQLSSQEGDFQHDQHQKMHVRSHATAAASNNINKGSSLFSSEDHHSSSGDNEPEINFSSSEKEAMMAVSLAAAAAATVSSSSEAETAAAAPPGDEDVSDDNDDGPQPLNCHQDQNHPAPITTPNDNDGINVMLHQNHQQPQQQHGFSNTINYLTNSSANDDSNDDCEAFNNNININNYRHRRRLHLPSNNPTWDDLSSLRDYINNFQFNQGGGGMGVGGIGGGGGYQQMMNASLMQREELLVYLASNEYANLRKVLFLFHDICGSGDSSHEDDSENDEIGGGNGGDNDVQLINKIAKESSNNYGIHSASPTSPNKYDDKDIVGRKLKKHQNKRRLQEKEDIDDNYARLLANIIKSILLLNDPEIIEYVTSDAPTFELLCAVLEHDPDLRERASHVEFLRRHAKFCAVIRIDDDGGSDDDADDNHFDNDIDYENKDSKNSNHDCKNNANKSDEYNQYGGRHLIANIHRLFRVNFLRDTILRPTMDESNLSTLVSLGQFMMCDIIRGVLSVRRRQKKHRSILKMEEEQVGCTNNSDVEVKCGDDAGISNDGGEDGDNYLVRIIRMLGNEIHAIRYMKWKEKEEEDSSTVQPFHRLSSPLAPHSASALSLDSSQSMTLWKQHVAPQDSSLNSRLIRRSGCLMFLNELFNMARMSLQQHEKDDFIETTVSMLTPLSMSFLAEDDESQKRHDGTEKNLTITATGGKSNDDIIIDGSRSSVDDNDVVVTDMNCDSQQHSMLPQPNTSGMARSSPSSLPHAKIHVNLLSLLSAVLSDPTTDVKERGAALDILGVITMHDPGLIRKHCLEYYAASVARQHDVVRPKPNELGELVFACPTDDLMLSLMYVMATENDAGLSLQTSEIIRIILDTESTGGEHQHTQVKGESLLGSAGGYGFLDEENNFNAGRLFGNSSTDDGGQTSSGVGGGGVTSIESEQNSFLALFYDRYVYWLVAPFAHVILAPRLVTPSFISEKETTISGIRRESKHLTNACTISGGNKDDSLPSLLRPIESCPVRASSTLEIISFCVRAHVHRMKFFMLRTRSLGIILTTLRQREGASVISGPRLPSGVRCLKLASLK